MRCDLLFSIVITGLFGLILMGCDQSDGSSDSDASTVQTSSVVEPVTTNTDGSSQPDRPASVASRPESSSKKLPTISGQSLPSTGKLVTSSRTLGSAGLAPASSQPDGNAGPDESKPRVVSMEGLPRRQGPGLSWITPPGWTLQGGANLRYASFDPPDGEEIEILITTFPGKPASLLKTVNRWRLQLGFGPVVESDLPNHVHHLNNSLEDVIFFDLSTSNGTRMLISTIYDPANNNNFYIRLHNNTNLVTKYEPDYLALVRSLKFEK